MLARLAVIGVMCGVLSTVAVAEIDTVTCNTAQTIYLRYALHLSGDPGPDVSGVQCIPYGGRLLVSVQDFDVEIELSPTVQKQAALNLTRLDTGNVYLGSWAFEDAWMRRSGVQTAKGGMSDAALVKLIPAHATTGETLRVPLRYRRPYNVVLQGNWGYQPLPYSDWGDLYLRIGNPDVGLGTTAPPE